MNVTTWIRVPKESMPPAGTETFRGISVNVEISPYDVPDSFRGRYDGHRGVFFIEFRYIDQEPSHPRKLDHMVTVHLGRYSQKLLAVEVAVDQHGVHVVQLHINDIVRNAESAVNTLKHTARPNARLNYAAVDQILKNPSSTAQLAVALT